MKGYKRMSRKNIFQLVEESYDIESEILKINNLFYCENYFVDDYEDEDYTLEKLIRRHLFKNWKYRGTCITLDEYMLRAEAEIKDTFSFNEENIVNNLETLENFIKLYFDNANTLYYNSHIQYYNEFKTDFCELINIIEKRMGLTVREYKDKVLLYPKNAPLEKVVDLCEDEDIQWELIRYVREDLSLTEKRKSLAFLATNLYIEDDAKEHDEHIKTLINKSTNILNNLHIRHNNKTGKWENKVLESLDEKDAILLCDMVYNEMLTIVLLREHKDFEKPYSEFNKKQKELKKKAREEK